MNQENIPPIFQRVWIMSDGKIGDLVQCKGVAQELGVTYETRVVAPRVPYVWMMPMGPIPPRDRPENAGSPIHPPFPDLIIASGWRTLAYIKEVKKRQGERVFTVFLKNPRINSDYLDLVWAPLHDQLTGANVMSSLASPHQMSPDVLAQKYAEKPSFLQALAKPLIGVLLGGDSKDYHFTPQDSARLAKSLRQLVEQGAGLAITSSRRTPDHLRIAIQNELKGKNIYWWDGQNPNPFGFILNHADYMLVTADSANMIGEACVKGKPVFVFRPSGGSKKFDRMLDLYMAHGAIKMLREPSEPLEPWDYEPLYVAKEIAREIEKRAGLQFNSPGAV